MPKRRVNEPGLNYLKGELSRVEQDVSAYRREIEVLRSDRSMLLDALEELTNNEEYWSKEALSMGIVWRLKNVLNNIKNG